MTVVYNNDLPDGLDLEDSVALDSEMLGLNPFRDRLCLVQVADKKGNCYLVKFDGTDYSAPNLKALLENKNIQKILHFARADLAFYKHYIGANTKNVYCTKIASKLSRTYSSKHSLKDLVAEIIHIELPKENQCSDWSVEHLTDEQLKYAANDVLYLHKIRDELNEKIKLAGREKLLQKCFDFVENRVNLDLAGFEDLDIFAHH